MVPSQPQTFDPEHLGAFLKHHHDEGERHFVTLLVGAGFSKSAGIPLAGEMAAELAEKAREFRLFAGNQKQPDASEYTWRMSNLRTSAERSRFIKRCIDRARDEETKQLRINWAHLLLAMLMAERYVHRILTTNFDPLIVEALALVGVEVRTYDLSLTGRYDPGILDPGTVVYLHGQSHSLLLVNSLPEIDQVKRLYPSVLQEAIDDSYLIVVGYSGECDPVLAALTGLRAVPRGLWWSHYSPSGAPPGSGAEALFRAHEGSCHLATGDDADTFMRRLVLDGMGLRIPDVVQAPLESLRSTLARIQPFPNGGSVPRDPVKPALEYLRQVKAVPDTSTSASPSTLGSFVDELAEGYWAVRIRSAATSGDWETFDRLLGKFETGAGPTVSQALGDGLLFRATREANRNDYNAAMRYLMAAELYGVSEPNKPWLPTTRAYVLSNQARGSGDTAARDRLFAEASAKYAEAVQVQPDMHEAFNNWGNDLTSQAVIAASAGNAPEAERLFAKATAKFAEALRLRPRDAKIMFGWGYCLSEYAKFKGQCPEGDKLFAEAAAKYGEAARIEPGMHEAFNNWGLTLTEWALRKCDTSQGDRLLSEAAEKYAEAIRLKPDKYESYSNWGDALVAHAKLAKTSGNRERLFAEATAKYAEAVLIKPDMHQAFFNWGTALCEQAIIENDVGRRVAFLTEASAKYGEAVRINPSMYEALTNWGATLCERAKLETDHAKRDRLLEEAGSRLNTARTLRPGEETVLLKSAWLASLRGRAAEAMGYLRAWKDVAARPSRRKLEHDDFDPIRASPEFQAFLAELPP